MLKELFYSHSPETVLHRYFTPLKHLPQEQAQRRATGAAWGTLISLLVGLGAAALGGRLGAAGDDVGRTRTTSTTTGTTGTTGTGSSF